MDEQEWLRCSDPRRMLAFVRSKALTRQVNLFACAGMRRVWHSLSQHDHEAVEIAERYANEQATQGQLDAAKAKAIRAAKSGSGIFGRVRRLLFGSRDVFKVSQVTLLRDICGNPFRPVTIDRAWFHWRDRLIRHLAEAAYQERHLPSGHLSPERLAVLADALDEAGCTDPDILDHLRSPGPHVQGCHVLDAILAKPAT